MIGTLQQCIDACNADATCVGFSRTSSLSSNAAGQCYLKNGGLFTSMTLSPNWLTYISSCEGEMRLSGSEKIAFELIFLLHTRP